MKQMFTFKILLVSATFLLGAMAAITAQAAEFKGVVGIGMDFGGDKLYTATYTDGTTVDVNANQGFAIHGGVVMVIDEVYETQATVGYKFGGPTAKNGSITWDTVPVELMQFLRASNVRMGLGFSYHNSPKLVIDIPGTSTTVNFNNALGTIAQIGWAPKDMPFSIDLRYTAIKYKQSNVANAQDISGNVVGLYAGFYF